MKLFVPVTRGCLKRIILNGASLYHERGSSDTGKAGAVRDAGGVFKTRGKAKEDHFFYKKDKQLLKDLKCHFDKQIKFHEERIRQHKLEMARIKKKQGDMDEK